MFAYCQWYRKLPSASTLLASIISSASFREGKEENKKEIGPITSRSLPSVTGPLEQPHYTAVRSEVIQCKAEMKRFWMERRHGRLRRIPSEVRGGCAVRGSTIWRGSKQSCSFTLNPQTMRFLISSSWGGWSHPWLVCRSCLSHKGLVCTDADWRDYEDHNCEHDFPKSRGCDSQRA